MVLASSLYYKLCRWLAMLVIASQFVCATATAQESDPAADGTAVAIPVVEIDPTATSEPANVAPSPTATEGSVDPTATTAPSASSVSYVLDDQATCVLAPDQSAALGSGGALDYRCLSELDISGEHLESDSLTLIWQIESSVTPGWRVILMPAEPASDADGPDVIEEYDSGARIEATRVVSLGSGDPAETVSALVTFEYLLRIERPACLDGVPHIEVRHDVAIGATAATVIDLTAGTDREPVVIEPPVEPIPAPSLTLGGGLDFGSIEATAAGLSQTRIDGTLDVTVSGLDQACGEWELHLSATPIVDGDGNPRDGFVLSVAGCDLTDGCLAYRFAAGPDAPPEQSRSITITLETPQFAALGAIGTTLDATLLAFDTRSEEGAHRDD